MIQVRHLTKTFWVHRKPPGFWGSVRSLVRREKVAKQAVRSVSFDVEEGEIVGLVGANGAGKTTLVKMLAGIVHPTSGEATVLGRTPWARDDALRRQISLIMGQKAQLWWDLPAADGFLLLREIYQVDPAVYAARLEELSRLLAVEDLLDIQVRRLSLGERMKMELIAALLHAPRVVYLDEPTIGLDLSAQRAVRDFILDYRARHRPVMLVTSHYMDDIERLCERILILRQGELVYDGSRQAVVERFARSKIVAVRLRGEVAPHALKTLEGLGRRLSAGEGQIRLEVPRDEVARVAGACLELLPVVDLSIEEEPLADVIERLQQSRRDELEGALTGAGRDAG
ncbi:MAG: ATP-binding cassette domain-containing protein [Acidobacteriota bacterium]